MRTVGIGIVGLGTVGGGTVRVLLDHRGQYLESYGIDVEVVRACSLEASDAERLGLADGVWTADWHDVVSDERVDIVIEVIGGEHPATEIYETAFAAGKHVVTANKALLGKKVATFAKEAHDAGVQLRCEAACAGGIPIVSTLEHDFIGNKILTIAGIMNGTTNYILSRMTDEGGEFADVLADAQKAGYAEADPTADVDGFDAASKIALLASMGFRTRVTTDDVYMQGIRKVSAADIEQASALGYSVKLLAIARATDAGVDVRVHPTMIPQTHQLAAVSGAMNAVYVVGDAIGETMFYGAGAGSFPTASAIVGDVLGVADHIAHGVEPTPEKEPFDRVLPILSIDDLETNFYVRLLVEDRAGTLAGVADVFARRGISIKSMNQLGSDACGACSVVFLTHTVRDADLRAATDELAGLDSVREVASVIRIEDIDAWTEGMFAN